MLILDNGTWRVGLLPDLGGSIAYGQVRLGEAWVDAMRPTPDNPGRAGETASFPLVPWSNRISGPVLRWMGGSDRRIRSLPVGAGWTRSRDFPAPSGRTFREMYRERQLGAQPGSTRK